MIGVDLYHYYVFTYENMKLSWIHQALLVSRETLEVARALRSRTYLSGVTPCFSWLLENLSYVTCAK